MPVIPKLLITAATANLLPTKGRTTAGLLQPAEEKSRKALKGFVMNDD
jgi:hypothetical protein